MCIALNSLMEKTQEDRDLINQILSSFSCNEDKDIELFLQKRAVKFEELRKSRTYLICGEEQFEEENFALDKLKIDGYVSVALKVLSVPENFSGNKRKEIDGLSGKLHGEPINDFPCYLIGQISRASTATKDDLSGEQLLQYAYDAIEPAVQAVGGRYIMVECQNNKKLIDFYEKNSFSEISRIPDAEREMVQMIRKL